MNNFGIFKLLSSLYGYYNRNKEQFPLSSLLNFGGNKNGTETEAISPAYEKKNDKAADKSSPRKTEVSPQPAPINRQMLATMTSHDDFVKRVLKNAVSAPHIAQDGTAITATHNVQPDRALTEK